MLGDYTPKRNGLYILTRVLHLSGRYGFVADLVELDSAVAFPFQTAYGKLSRPECRRRGIEEPYIVVSQDEMRVMGNEWVGFVSYLFVKSYKSKLFTVWSASTDQYGIDYLHRTRQPPSTLPWH